MTAGRAYESRESLVAPVEKCLWGDAAAKSERWTPERNGWHFSRPLNAGPELLSGIEGK